MGEIKNTFIKSKMNKDLDARILPPGEYRDAENIAVSKSEGADVGAVENVLGNRKLTDLGIPTTVVGAEAIGFYTENGGNRVFVFVTNYSDSSSDLLSNAAPVDSYCAIICYTIDTAQVVSLVEGHWLNFSKTQPVYGIDVLEDLLFWTDNRNQPRKINITRAIDRPSTSGNPYYQIEENISVAKYYPYNAAEVYQEFEVTVNVTKFGAGLTTIASDLLSYPQANIGPSVCEITSALPPFPLHPGLKFYIKSAPGANNITTYPYYNEIRNYPVANGINSSFADNLLPYSNANQPGLNNYEYTFSTFDAADGIIIPSGPTNGAVPDPNVFWANVPFTYTDALGDVNQWTGEAVLVFVSEQQKNKTQKWLDPTYRPRIANIFDADTTAPVGESMRSQGNATGLIPLPLALTNGAPDPAPVGDMSQDYKDSVGNCVIQLDLKELNGWGLGQDDGNIANAVKTLFLKWYIQPGMKISNPLLSEDGSDYIIDQIFPDGYQEPGGLSRSGFLISIRKIDAEDNFITDWRWPESIFTEGTFTATEYLGLHFPNPHYSSTFSGDTDYLTDRFCRLSYRFEYDDGEFSLIAPFTQSLFKPQHNGYYLKSGEYWSYETNGWSFLSEGTLPTSDVMQLGVSTLNKLYENSINAINLNIKTPIIDGVQLEVGELQDKLKLKNIQIIYEDSSGTALRVIKTIPVTDVSIVGKTVNDYYTFEWEGDKPFITLPEKEIIRTSDKVPIKALGQAISGNRVIYANYVDKHTSPSSLDYDVGSSRKFHVNNEFTCQSETEYANNSLKQNRLYQVGIVLADKFGRQSDVVLSPASLTTIQIDKDIYSGDTTTHTYLRKNQVYFPLVANPTTVAGENISNWVGDSLKILFNTSIPDTIANAQGYPGLYSDPGQVSSVNLTSGGTLYPESVTHNVSTTAISGVGFGMTVDIIADAAGIITSVVLNKGGKDYSVGDSISIDPVYGVGSGGTVDILTIKDANPLGWYTYKVVVKQQEQDYYNLYMPSGWNGEPLLNLSAAGDPPPSLEEVCTFTLIGDNINKIPRDITESNSEVVYSSSSMTLYPRVSPYGGRMADPTVGSGFVTWVGAPTLTGMVFNDEIADTVVNLGNINDIYSLSRDTLASPLLAEIDNGALYKQVDNPYICTITNSIDRSPFYTFDGGIAPHLNLNVLWGNPPLGTKVGTSGIGVTEWSNPYALSNWVDGNLIIETEPVQSKLDIYWETSTSGLISELNYLIENNSDENIPFSLDETHQTFGEETSNLWVGLFDSNLNPAFITSASPGDIVAAGFVPDPWIFQIQARNSIGDLILPGAIVSTPTLIVTDANGTDVSSQFLISAYPASPVFRVYITDITPTYLQDVNIRDFTFTITYETYAEIPTDPNNVVSFSINKPLTNRLPNLRAHGSSTGLNPVVAGVGGIVWGDGQGIGVITAAIDFTNASNPAIGPTATLPIVGGSGSGATCIVTVANPIGGSTISIVNTGTMYEVGDIVTITDNGSGVGGFDGYIEYTIAEADLNAGGQNIAMQNGGLSLIGASGPFGPAYGAPVECSQDLKFELISVIETTSSANATSDFVFEDGLSGISQDIGPVYTNGDWVSENRIRALSTVAAGTYRIIYKVTDANGNGQIYEYPTTGGFANLEVTII